MAGAGAGADHVTTTSTLLIGSRTVLSSRISQTTGRYTCRSPASPPPTHPQQQPTNNTMPKLIRVGWHKEHFLSPLLQFVAADAGKTVELVECPGGTGDMQAKLKNDEVDVVIGTSLATSHC